MCFIVVLALLVGILVGKLWSKRVYDAVWRDGASWAMCFVRSSYTHLPRKLRSVLEGLEHNIQGEWYWRPTREEIVSDNAKEKGDIEE